MPDGKIMTDAERLAKRVNSLAGGVIYSALRASATSKRYIATPSARPKAAPNCTEIPAKANTPEATTIIIAQTASKNAACRPTRVPRIKSRNISVFPFVKGNRDHGGSVTKVRGKSDGAVMPDNNASQSETVRIVAEQLFETWKRQQEREAKETRRWFSGNLGGFIGALAIGFTALVIRWLEKHR